MLPKGTRVPGGQLIPGKPPCELAADKKHVVAVADDGFAFVVANEEEGRRVLLERAAAIQAKRADEESRRAAKVTALNARWTAFRDEYRQLVEKHGMFLNGCGCCSSPFISLLDDSTRVNFEDTLNQEGNSSTQRHFEKSPDLDELG